jgi:hypothetical protein
MLWQKATPRLPPKPELPLLADCRLTHPCPTNPFRTRADEDMWYVEPTLEQRQLAMTLGLSLHGIY